MTLRLAQAPLKAGSASIDERLQQLAGARYASPLQWRALLSLLLIAVSLLNALHLARSHRTYSLFSRLPTDRISSPNARVVPARFGSSSFNLRRWLWRSAMSWIRPSSAAAKPNQLQIQELSIWTPSDLSKRVFLLYSPVTALVLQQIVRSPSLSTLLVYAILQLQTWALVYLYDGLVRDRQLLSAEVAREYDRKVVAPLVTKDYWQQQADRQRAAELSEEVVEDEGQDPFVAVQPARPARRSGWAAESGDLMRQ